MQGAKDAYQKAIDSGDIRAAAVAAAPLGVLLAEQGDVQGAKDALQKATASLGLLLADLGEPDG